MLRCRRHAIRKAPPCPPRAERVVKQELDHVVLGKELRHCRQLLRTDFLPRLVYPVFLLRLPELVHPAEAIICIKDLRRKRSQELLEGLAMLSGQRNPEDGIVRSKDLWQHALRESRGQGNPISAP